ncbi:MAG: phosphoserine phosphatase [Rhodoferax sp.]|nr:phosphoserine phosphatase [Rhodoferax sp.]
MMKLTLFDLDHTLLAVDSDYTWGVFTTEIGWTDPVAFKKQNDIFYEQYKAGTLDIHDYVRFAVDAVRKQGSAKAAVAHADFMQRVVRPAITPQARALVQRHQAAGEEVVIVTATNEFVTRPIAAELGVDQLIAVELEREPGEAGWLTGAIKGVPSAREGKVTRVAEWLAARGLDWADADITFYTDSVNDIALMEKVDHPVATNPDDRLRAIATARGWPILDLFQKQT